MTAVLVLDQSVVFQGIFKTRRNTEENEDMVSRLQIEMGKSPWTTWVFLQPVFQVVGRGWG